MSADPLEGRERARQEFEKWACVAYGAKPSSAWMEKYSPNGRSRYVQDEMQAAWEGWQARGEQERWISVEERLPEQGQAVLVWFGELDSNAYMDVWTYRGDNQYFRASTKRTRDDVTHWMPTPAPPVHKGDS